MNKIIDIARISRIGQITIPKEVREILNLNPDDKVIFKEENGKIIIEKA